MEGYVILSIACAMCGHENKYQPMYSWDANWGKAKIVYLDNGLRITCENCRGTYEVIVEEVNE